MHHRNAAETYQRETARGASAIGGVVALYDTVLRDFRRASAAAAAGNIEARVFELNHALTVIGELNGALDYQRGGEAAKRFQNFYEVTRGLILEANLRSTPESLEHLIALYSPVRQAWKKIDGQIFSGEPRQAPPAASHHTEAADLADNSVKWNA
jgi:flagellar secretion chaperone FliS